MTFAKNVFAARQKHAWRAAKELVTYVVYLFFYWADATHSLNASLSLGM